MEIVDALGTRRAHTAQRSSQLPSTGRSGPARPGSAIGPLSSADPRTEAELELSNGDQSSPAFFQCTLLAARRGGTASAAVGLGWDSAGTRSPELDAQRSAPRGQDLPRALPAADPTPHAYTQCPRSGVRSAPPAGAFSERSAIFSFPLLRGGRPGKRAASRWQRTREQVPIRLESPRTGGEARGVAGRRGGRGRAAGGWVCAPASDEGGDRRRDEAQGGSAAGRDPLCPVPCAPPPPGGARRVRGDAARALLLLAFPPPLPTIGRL